MSTAVCSTQVRWREGRPVDLAVDHSTREAFLGNHVSHLANGGVFIPTEHPLPIDSELEINVTLPGRDEPISARGRVVWNCDIPRGTTRLVHGMGIKLVDMSLTDRERLSSFLVALGPSPR